MIASTQVAASSMDRLAQAEAFRSEGLAGLASHLDLEIPTSIAPIDVAVLIRRARELGVRSVRVPVEVATAAHDALRGRVRVRTTCDQVLGWPGNSLLMHIGERLEGRLVDELDIPVDASVLGDATWLSPQLRRVVARCHAHGAFAAVALRTAGLTTAELRTQVRGLARASVDALALVVPEGGALPLELVAAAVDETAGRLAVRVVMPGVTFSQLRRMFDLGVQSVSVTPDEMNVLFAAAVGDDEATAASAKPAPAAATPRPKAA